MFRNYPGCQSSNVSNALVFNFIFIIDHIIKIIVIKKNFFRAQGITDPERLTCTNSWANARISQGEKAISSHVQAFSGLLDAEFDGKQCTTAVGRNRTEVIDHYTLTSQGKYLDNFSLPKPKKWKVNGKWKKEKMQSGLIIAIKLHETLKKFLARASLVFLGADSCATKTGWKKGAIGKKHAFKKYD